MKDWKSAERRIASILGGRRIPVSGRGDNLDIEHDRLSVEVKARTSFPAWLETALRQAECSARNGKTPAVVLHGDCKPYREALVVLRLSEFAELLGELEARCTVGRQDKRTKKGGALCPKKTHSGPL